MIYNEYIGCHNVKVKYFVHDVNITLMDDKLIEKLYNLGIKMLLI